MLQEEMREMRQMFLCDRVTNPSLVDLVELENWNFSHHLSFFFCVVLYFT